MSSTPNPGHFERQHERLDALLHAHLLAVAGAAFLRLPLPLIVVVLAPLGIFLSLRRSWKRVP